MATRSALLNSTTGQLIYVHWDGYPNGDTGRMAILTNGYNNKFSVEELFQRCQNTDISVLGPSIESSEFYDQRGESGSQWKNIRFEHVIVSALDAGCEYIYIWDGNNWSYTDLLRLECLENFC